VVLETFVELDTRIVCNCLRARLTPRPLSRRGRRRCATRAGVFTAIEAIVRCGTRFRARCQPQ
jgi:hypothetical protein